ncbi:auxilin-related protein 2 [Phtheirospermum japonicum]|uniref:Auxilin-related protein 2 n=1 Tax=Phtheirospermum japonicum TaxID=374723 RepID=A0A830B0X8_9LAMI|nr:auxilin-related protein 2 [Phtheirospermum japonicum]
MKYGYFYEDVVLAPNTYRIRHFCGHGFSYEEIFRRPSKAPPPVRRSGRSLPEFRIPGQQSSDFYSDIFGSEDYGRVVRSRSRSKASSSSVLSSEELSPLRTAAFASDGDDDVSYFASKLRPINVKSRWTSRKMAHEEDKQTQQHKMMPPFAFTPPFYNTTENNNNNNNNNNNFKTYSFGLSPRNASPETISLEPISNGSFRISADDLELNSPSSPVSSVCQSPNKETKTEDECMDEEDEAMSSYVIEINSDNREGACESNGVDEAIAWAKEKFKMSSGHEVLDQGHTDSFGSLDEQQDKWGAEEETEQFENTVQTETQELDEKLRFWSNGNEADIKLLLSSLHQILWPNSGWLAIHSRDITGISQVKKAYQKACLCLHPDKLQQRGATIREKYIAEKAFSVLQDAWVAFVAQQVL